jgi:Phosphotransferase enzyme family
MHDDRNTQIRPGNIFRRVGIMSTSDERRGQTKFGKLIGTGKEAEVYGQGTTVLKLYRSPESKSSAFREAATLAAIETSGLHVPRVKEVSQFGRRWGIVMSRAAGVAYGGSIAARPHKTPAYLDAMVRLHRQVHACSGAMLPALKSRLESAIRSTPLLPAAQRVQLLSVLAGLPDGMSLCHGDFHPWNILGSTKSATMIDWLDASRGDPAADVCRSYVLMRKTGPQLAEAYVDAYAQGNPRTVAVIMAWLPVVAAARLSEGVIDEEDDLLRMTALEGGG